jgi:hypothetical protein
MRRSLKIRLRNGKGNFPTIALHGHRGIVVTIQAGFPEKQDRKKATETGE